MSAEEAFTRLTDWPRHAEHVPLTTITAEEHWLVARTGLGPLGVDDPMEVVSWDPPRHCRLEKRGRVLTGWAEVDVTPLVAISRADRCRVQWREVAHVSGVPRVLGGIEAKLGQVLFSRVVDGLLRA